jgi:beta-glucosidase
MTESPLLRDILQGEWGFDGVVMSDWFAARSTQASAAAGLDLLMPGPAGPWGRALVAAVRDGSVDEAAVDDKLLRILRLAARVGALVGGAPAAAPPSYDDASVASTLRGVAAAGFVLVRNERSPLPLDSSALSRVAVIGPNAAAPRTVGGGSATVFAPYVVSPLEGLRAALGSGVEVEHRVGVWPSSRIPVAGAPWVRTPGGDDPGVEVRFLARDGAVLATEQRPGCAFTWLGSFGHGLSIGDVARVEVHAVLRATDAGTYVVGGSGVGRYELSVGGEVVFDGRLELTAGADVVEGMMIPPQALHDISLDGGDEVAVVLAHEVDAGNLTTALQLNLLPPHGGDDEEIERAVAAARRADVAVVVVGTTEEVESEGFDRTSLALPGRQDELVTRVAEANPRTVVVVNAGAPVLLPWAESVAAIVLAWFAGQEFGNALADVLLGAAEPGGRLPTTWPSSEDGLPSTQPVDGVLCYDEGLFVGYRGYDGDGRVPRYPFGHGLGYTTWEWVSIEAPARVLAGAQVPVAVCLRNSGSRRGRQVVQVYASCRDSAVERPLRWLAGFAVVEADAGEQVVATVTLAPRAFEHWDVADRRWRTEHATFALAAGASCAELPLRTEIAIARR